jgi:hypothetical protein
MAEDAYNILADKEALEMVLQPGLKEEHQQHKDRIVSFFMDVKDRMKVEDLRVYWL